MNAFNNSHVTYGLGLFLLPDVALVVMLTRHTATGTWLRRSSCIQARWCHDSSSHTLTSTRIKLHPVPSCVSLSGAAVGRHRTQSGMPRRHCT